jgi:dolichyl-phosphate beta-glucosyltransferase
MCSGHCRRPRVRCSKSRLKDITYSIVIPAYNEGARLGATLEKVLAYVRRAGMGCGSDRGERRLARQYGGDWCGALPKKDPVVRLVENPGNRGKGYSVRNGMLKARGEMIVFSDADLSSPIEEMPKLLEALAAGADIAIGSRWLRAELQTRRQSLHRQVFGRVFNLLLDYFGAAIQRHAVRVQGFHAAGGTDDSAAAAHRALGLRSGDSFPGGQVWVSRAGSARALGAQRRHTDSSALDGARMFQEMLRIRWYDLTGKYDGGVAVSRASSKDAAGTTLRREFENQRQLLYFAGSRQSFTASNHLLTHLGG